MPDKVNASKVVCYIVRDGQLLVFRHADYDLEHVGLQVLAGSIRPGESPEDAGLREAREETGLSQFSVVRKLGEIIYDISPYRYEIQHRHVFQLQVDEPTEQRWPTSTQTTWRPRSWQRPGPMVLGNDRQQNRTI